MKGLLVAVAVAGSACAIGSGPPVRVVLVTLDTTRADRLSPYGFGDAHMPALDRLARHGVVFDQATVRRRHSTVWRRLAACLPGAALAPPSADPRRP